MLVHTASSPDHHQQLVLWRRAGVLGALDLGGFETRNPSVMRLVGDAERAGLLPDFPPCLVNTGDQPINRGDESWRVLSFSSAEGYDDVAVPDFLFDGWPQVGLGDYEHASNEARAAGQVPAERLVVGWIGNCDTHPGRARLREIASAHPDVLDVRHVRWVPGNGTGKMATASANDLSLADQVRLWSALIDVEGNGWSARLKLLLHSGRPVLMQERPWREWFFDELEPMRHVIPVRRDLSDLVERARWVVEHPDEAARIGITGQAYAAERLTRSSAVETWAQALRVHATAPGSTGLGPPLGRERLEALARVLGAH